MTAQAEAWHPVPRYEGYEVSNHGRVRSVERIDAAGRRLKGCVLKPAMQRGKYATVCLYSNKEQHRRLVRRLMLEAGVPQ